MDKEKISKYYDKILLPKARECMSHPGVDTTTKWYISQAMWYINHDLADERNPVLRIVSVAGTLTDDHFYDKVYPEDEKLEVVKLLRQLGQLAKEFEEICVED